MSLLILPEVIKYLRHFGQWFLVEVTVGREWFGRDETNFHFNIIFTQGLIQHQERDSAVSPLVFRLVSADENSDTRFASVRLNSAGDILGFDRHALIFNVHWVAARAKLDEYPTIKLWRRCMKFFDR